MQETTGKELFHVTEFSGSDQAYREWLQTHPNGFVLNMAKGKDTGYSPLHRAQCRFISNFDERLPGAFTERDFIKICADEVSHLREWIKLHGRPDGSFSSESCNCYKGSDKIKPAVKGSLTATARPPGITTEELHRIIESARKVPPAKGNYLINDYVENLLLTVTDFMLHTKVVEKANQHYKQNCRLVIGDFHQLKQRVAMYPDTKEGNIALAQYLWGYNLWTRAQLLRRLIEFMEAEGVTTQEQLHTWANRVDYSDFKGKIPGLALAVFQWLVMRQGVETVKPDIWLHRFIEKTIGRKVTDEVVISTMTEAAHQLKIKAYQLDWRIWEHLKSS